MRGKRKKDGKYNERRIRRKERKEDKREALRRRVMKRK